MIQLFIIEFLTILLFFFNGQIGLGPFMSGMQQPDCLDCHGDLLEGKQVHYPAEDDCNNCHESTGVFHPLQDSAGFQLMDRIPALCYYCHEERVKSVYPHQPVEQGNCLGCHDAHGSTGPSLLRLPEPDLCLSCHNQDFRTDSTQTVNISRLVNKKMIVHTAITDGGCMVCHQSHGSEFRALLVDRFPAEDYLPAKSENFELCFLCHNTGILDKEETESDTGFRNGKQNLHWVHINGEKGRNCRMCHNIHGSPQPFLIEEIVGYGNWEMRMNFVPEEQGGSCLPGCHGKLSYRR
jgi:predicted CXXCH cytochrome family protein